MSAISFLEIFDLDVTVTHGKLRAKIGQLTASFSNINFLLGLA